MELAVALHFNNTYAFCPSCGGRLGPRVLKEGNSAQPVCAECEFIYFQNPKVAAGVILMHEERLVLVRRSIEPGYGKWVFPGGYVDLGEDVPAAARREAWEEAGVRVEIDRLLNVYSYPERPVVVIVYVGRVVEGTPCAGDECSEMQTFAPHEVPWDDLAFPSTHQALRDFLDSLE
jgi:8-oxo-dGTP diphosphatase